MSGESPILEPASGVDRPRLGTTFAGPTLAGPSLAHERTRTDLQSFGVLYCEHYGAIAGLIYRRTGDAHATEDLTSDVFLAAYRSWPHFRGDVPVSIWLRRIAHNRVNRWARREVGLRGILRRVPLLAALAPDLDANLERRPAMRALLSLPVEQQSILSAHYIEGMSLSEAALMLAITPAAAKSRLARAREALRNALKKEDHP